MNIDYAGQTNVGRVRGNNEDSYLVGKVPGGHIFLVADGIGGHPGGEVASKLAVETILRSMQSGGSLETAIKMANTAVYLGKPARMGTTIVAAHTEGDQIVIGHLGDSRAYCLRGGVLYLLTRDHTPTGEEGIPLHSNLLLKAVGMFKSVEPTMTAHVMERGDCYLLCSDGLYAEVNTDEMKRILATMATTRKVDVAANALVDLAVENGGSDNVTVVCFRVS